MHRRRRAPWRHPPRGPDRPGGPDAPVTQTGEASTLLQWYDFGREEWRHVRRGVAAFLLGTVLPVGGFYLLYRLASFQVAVLVVLTWALATFVWHYARTRALDVFSVTTMALACLKATAGVVSGNLTLYLVWPSVENLLYGGVFLGTALLGRPLLGAYARRLYPVPPSVGESEAFQRGFLGASVAWAVVSVLRAGARLWLVDHLPVGAFLLVDSVIGWPVYGMLIWFTGWYPMRVLRQDGLVLP